MSAKLSRQWLVGDGGIRGVRLVHPPGYVKWQGYQYQHFRLVPFIGDYVFIEDFCGAGIEAGQCLWTMHHSGRSGSPYPGAKICDLEMG